MFVVMFRTLILFTIVIFAMRIMGKRQIGQLQPYELAVLIMISALAAIPMEDISIPLFNSIIPIILLLCFQILVSYAAQKSEKVRAAVDGRPSIVIENGKIVEAELRELHLNINDLLEQLRICGFSNIADVEFAVFETNGKMTVIPKSQCRPLQPRDIGVSTRYEGLPHPLVIDGNVNYDNLGKVQKDELWLKTELSRFGITELKEVLFANLDTEGRLYYQLKDKYLPR
ncbi:MAG: DUF421 domain-containing protein [Dethiobacter sp.]|jgi:uncharacterized membrane protein YcaP (DUF421 family)|nr:DUF421 domain-containing protein [Dethiobacter sp.]